jgi:hypothetical protein
MEGSSMRPLAATTLALALSLGAAGAIAPTHGLAQVSVGVGIGVGFAPPPLPYYEQPPAPGYGYLWTPGYWGWSDYEDDYYWVPGTWVLPPAIGFLWTPPWWGFVDGAYVFNAGYWGPFVGFYGGINYGFGYTGWGYEGGYWRGRDFYYNRAINNVTNVNLTHVYNRPVATAGGLSRVSFSGGPRGVHAVPTDAQLRAARGARLGATSAQMQHMQAARAQPLLRASVNHGAPSIAATSRPAALHGHGVVAAAGAGGATAHAALSAARGPARFQTHGAAGPGSPGAPRTASAIHATQGGPHGRSAPLAQARQTAGYHAAYHPAYRSATTRAQGFRPQGFRPQGFAAPQRFAAAGRPPAMAMGAPRGGGGHPGPAAGGGGARRPH